MKNKILSLCMLAFLLTSTTLWAGPWPRPKGSGFFKLDFSAIRAGQVFDRGGELVPIRTIGNYITSVYGEYGFTDRLTGILYAPVFVRNTLNETEGRQTGRILEEGDFNNGIGDFDLGIKYGLIVNKPVVLSATLMLGLPTGDATHEGALFTGDGEFNQLLKLEAGIGKKKWYGSAAIGINHRTRDFSEEFRYDLEFGYKLLNDKMILAMKINGIESFNNGNASGSTMGLFANNVEYLAFNPEVLYHINESIGLAFRFGGAFKGQNVLGAPSLSVGAYVQW